MNRDLSTVRGRAVWHLVRELVMGISTCRGQGEGWGRQRGNYAGVMAVARTLEFCSERNGKAAEHFD